MAALGACEAQYCSTCADQSSVSTSQCLAVNTLSGFLEFATRLLLWLVACRFVGGVMGAKISPSLMLVGGLAVTALLNLATTLPGTTVLTLTLLWAANGCVQVRPGCLG